jgi:hypothetical protein
VAFVVEAHVGAVDLHQVSWQPRYVVSGLSSGVRPNLKPPPHPGVAQVSQGEAALAFKPGQDAADHGDRRTMTLVLEQDRELVLAPARVFQAQL